MSNPNIEQFTAVQKANIEVMVSLMRTAFQGMEQLAALNIAATRELFNNSVAGTQQMMNAKDPQELIRVNNPLSHPNMQKMMEYSRNVYDLMTQMQKEVTTVMESSYSNFSRTASSAIEKTSANAPVGGDVFAATMKSLLSATNQAFEKMQGISRQMAEITEANIQAASSATTKAVSSAAPRGKK